MKAVLVIDIDANELPKDAYANIYVFGKYYEEQEDDFIACIGDVPLKPLNKIVKAGDRNLIIYERAWLYSHLEEEFEMQKKARDWEKQNESITFDRYNGVSG